MNNSHLIKGPFSVLSLCTVILFSSDAIAQPREVQKRINFLEKTCDSVLVFEKKCSYCLSGWEEEALVVYKKKRFRFEAFKWDNKSDKLKIVKGKVGSRLALNIGVAANRIVGKFKKDGEPVYESLRLDTREDFGSHGSYIELSVKFGKNTIWLSSLTNVDQNISFYLQNHYDYGVLILLLNMIVAKDNYFIL